MINNIETIKKQNNDTIIVVKPKISTNTSDIENIIKNKVDINNLNINECTLKKSVNGNVIIRCSNKQERQKIAEKIGTEVGADFSVVLPKTGQLKIKIVNIDSCSMEKSEDELIKNIVKQNGLMSISGASEIKTISKWKVEKYNNMAMVIEANKQIYENILMKGFLNIGWNRCKVYEYVRVIRCFKCWGFFHIAKHCKKARFVGNVRRTIQQKIVLVVG